MAGGRISWGTLLKIGPFTLSMQYISMTVLFTGLPYCLLLKHCIILPNFPPLSLPLKSHHALEWCLFPSSPIQTFVTPVLTREKQDDWIDPVVCWIVCFHQQHLLPITYLEDNYSPPNWWNFRTFNTESQNKRRAAGLGAGLLPTIVQMQGGRDQRKCEREMQSTLCSLG